MCVVGSLVEVREARSEPGSRFVDEVPVVKRVTPVLLLRGDRRIGKSEELKTQWDLR